MHRNLNFITKKLDSELGEILYSPSHKYSYLDDKINILSNIMVDSLNKLIFEINNIKNNNKKINLEEKNNDFIHYEKNKNANYSLMEKKIFFNSPLNRENSYTKSRISESQGKIGQKFKIINKDNDKKKLLNQNMNTSTKIINS